jgi:hypothetical protein
MAHRHLIGVDSPPDDHVPDNMTLGPNLPAGWDGDAWTRESSHGNSYWLRAWNKSTGQYAIARAEKYEDARKRLLETINNGGNGRAVVSVTIH